MANNKGFFFSDDNGQNSNNQSNNDSSNKGGNKNSGSKGGRSSGTSKRGFASMNRDEQRRIASKGGKAAHQRGTAHEWTSEEARAAGRKGGQS